MEKKVSQSAVCVKLGAFGENCICRAKKCISRPEKCAQVESDSVAAVCDRVDGEKVQFNSRNRLIGSEYFFLQPEKKIDVGEKSRPVPLWLGREESLAQGWQSERGRVIFWGRKSGSWFCAFGGLYCI